MTKSQIRLLIREELSNAKDSNDGLDLESIASEIKKLYPAFDVRVISGAIHLSFKTPRFVYSLKLAPGLSFNVTGRYESNFYKDHKWVCQVSGRDQFGHGTRHGGKDPIEVIEKVIDSLRGRIERIKKEYDIADYFEKNLLNT